MAVAQYTILLGKDKSDLIEPVAIIYAQNDDTCCFLEDSRVVLLPYRVWRESGSNLQAMTIRTPDRFERRHACRFIWIYAMPVVSVERAATNSI